MFGVEVKYDINVRIGFRVQWIRILVGGINYPRAVTRR